MCADAKRVGQLDGRTGSATPEHKQCDRPLWSCQEHYRRSQAVFCVRPRMFLQRNLKLVSLLKLFFCHLVDRHVFLCRPVCPLLESRMPNWRLGIALDRQSGIRDRRFGSEINFSQRKKAGQIIILFFNHFFLSTKHNLLEFNGNSDALGPPSQRTRTSS